MRTRMRRPRTPSWRTILRRVRPIQQARKRSLRTSSKFRAASRTNSNNQTRNRRSARSRVKQASSSRPQKATREIRELKATRETPDRQGHRDRREPIPLFRDHKVRWGRWDRQDGKDGRDGVDGKDGKPGKDGSPDTPEELLSKLKSLPKENKLSYDDLKDTPRFPRLAGTGFLREISDVNTTGLAHGQVLVWNANTSHWEPGSASGATPKRFRLSPLLNGSTKVFAIPANTAIVSINSSSVPFI